MPTHTIIEFQDTYCNVLQWESARSTYTLRHALRVALEHKANGPAPAAAGAPEDGAIPPAEGPLAASEEAPTERTDESAAQRNAAALRKALKKAGIKVESALAVVPKHWATLRVVTLPGTKEEELAEMAQFEAERHIPFNVDRHIIAHRVMSVEGIEGAHVVLAALDGPPAEQITQLFDDTGIVLEGIEISTVALVNALQHTGAWNQEADPTVALVNIGESNTDIVILQKGEPIFARSTPLGVDKVREAIEATLSEQTPLTPEPVLALRDPDAFLSDQIDAPGPVSSARIGPDFRSNRLIREVRRTLDYAQREFNSQSMPSRLFLSGPGIGIAGLEGMFNSSFGVESLVIDCFAASARDAGVRLKRNAKGEGVEDAPGFYALAGGALLSQVAPKGLSVSLMPPAYVMRQARARRKRILMVVGAVVLLALVGAFLSTNHVLSQKKANLAQLRQEIKKNSQEVDKLAERETVVDILKRNTLERGSALAILDSISEWKDLFRPDNMSVSVTDFQYDEKYLKLSGHARDYPELNDFERRLTESGHFRSITITNRSKIEVRSGEQVVEYSLNCWYKEKEAETQ